MKNPKKLINNEVVKVVSLNKSFLKNTLTLKIKLLLHIFLKVFFNYSYNVENDKKIISNLSFSVKRGDALAILGLNGQGKSTLMAMISGLTYPDSGYILTNGSINSIINLGFGLRLRLSAYENINFVLKLHKIPKAKFNSLIKQIIEFSDLSNKLDQSISSFSSGMYSRLVFSILIHLPCDIIIIDELLAVGDKKFKEKCINKIMDLQKSGMTFIIASHSNFLIKRICNKALLMNDQKYIFGPTDKVLKLYEKI